MASYTPNMGLKKPAGTDYVLVGDLNTNMDVVDSTVGKLSNLDTPNRTNLVEAINQAARMGGDHPPIIDPETGLWMDWDFTTLQYVLSDKPSTGNPGGFGTPEATTTTLAPGEQASVIVDANGPDTEKIFTFSFKIPAGEKGEQGLAGKDGRSFTVLGLYPTFDDLMDEHPVGNEGDAYSVGTKDKSEVYIWDVDAEAWVNIGRIKGDTGNVLFATFVANFEDGQLYMITPEGYEGLNFRINPDSRQLEVGINTDVEPGVIGEQTGAIWTPIGEIFPVLSGDYDETKSYERMALVLYGSNSYVCKQACSGILPTNKDYWQAITAVVAAGELPELAKVATTGSYKDLKDKPEIPDLSVLAEVAWTGEYGDLLNPPTIPSTVSELINDTGFQTVEQVQAAITNVTNTIEADLSGYVPVTRKVAGKPLETDIILTKSDVGLDNVDNTSDANKPISTATQTALDAKLDKSGGTMTGTLTTANTAVGTFAARNIQITTTDLTAGTSSLATGRIVMVYE